MTKFWTYFYFCLFSFIQAGFAAEQIQLQTFSSYSRLAVEIDENVTPEWKPSSSGFVLILKDFTLADSPSALAKLVDSRLGSLKVEETLEGVRVIGKWRFPDGNKALAHPEMEFFEYREKNPIRLIFDFWVKPGPTLKEQAAARLHSELTQKVKKLQGEGKQIEPLKDASITALSLNETFCNQPLSEKNDIFLSFYPVRHKTDLSVWLPDNSADSQFQYYSPKKRTKEAQYVRLALRLYRQGKPALAVRVVDFLNTEFPKSEFQLEMLFLKANCLIKLGHQTGGELIFRELMNTSKTAPVSLHAALFLTRKLIDQNLPLPILENFLWLIQNHPDHPLSWLFHLGAAEAFYEMHQTQQALKEYRWVIDHGKEISQKAEAAFRLGDLYLARFQYEQAVAAYSQALEYFSTEKKRFPLFFLNKGEALYQVGQYDQAKTAFLKFLNDYPSHPEGWRATFRVAEILDRNATTPAIKEEARQWYYQTINQYPSSPGVTLARIRLLPCGDHGGFTLEAAERFFDGEATSFEAYLGLNQNTYQDFRALGRVRTLASLGDPSRALRSSIEELRVAKNPLVRETLIDQSHSLFRKVILEDLSKGQLFEALSFFSSKYSELLVTHKENNLDYLLSLSNIAIDMGLPEMGLKILKQFEEAQARFPHPREDLENEKKLLAAKAEMSKLKSTSDIEEIKKLVDVLTASKDEGRFLYQREVMLGILNDWLGNVHVSIRHLSKAQLIQPSPGLSFYLAKMKSKVKDFDSALNIYADIEKNLFIPSKLDKNNKETANKNAAELGIRIPYSPTPEELMFAKGEIFEEQGKFDDLVKNYSKAVDQKIGGLRMSYELARSLMKRGRSEDFERARQILGQVSSSNVESEPDRFWKRMATEAIQDR